MLVKVNGGKMCIKRQPPSIKKQGIWQVAAVERTVKFPSAELDILDFSLRERERREKEAWL